MEPLKGRDQILAWHKRAKDRLVARRAQKDAFGLGKLSKDDAEIYEVLIEQYFEKLKARHNAEIERKRKGGGAGTK